MSVVGPALLKAEGLSVLRAGRPVLNDLSIAFRRGEWCALVGPNGTGKSTLLATLAGLLVAHTGRVELATKAIEQWSARDRARLVTWFGRTTAVDGDLAAHEIVRLGRLPLVGLFGVPSAADETAIAAALAAMEVSAFSHRRLNELSGGEQQRVLLARALAAEAPVLLLDEPTVHLDAPHQRRLVETLRRRVLAGMLVVTVLHDVTSALAAERLVVLSGNGIEADGSPDEPRVRAALTAVFEQAFTIERVVRADGASWAAIPNQ